MLDLSEDFPVGNTDNPDANYLEGQLGRDVRRMLVLENGEIVMEYQRDTVEDDAFYNLHSMTKSFMALFLGVAIESEEYDLSYNDTLGEIFPERAAWATIENEAEMAFKKNITVLELMTMTSGLDAGIGINPFDLFDIPNAVGESLEESLGVPGYSPEMKGKFLYLSASNIPSYVLQQTTNSTPLEFVSREIFPSLGIAPDEVRWDANDDGIQTSFSNLYLTARGIAKLTQLYVQKGLAAPGTRIVSEEFIASSLSKALWNPDFQSWYGYMWNTVEPNTPDIPGAVSCAWGWSGQAACLSYDTARVTVFQRSNTVWDQFDSNAYAITIDAMSTNFTFEPAPPTASPAPTETPVSGAVVSFSLRGDRFCFVAAVILSFGL